MCISMLGANLGFVKGTNTTGNPPKAGKCWKNGISNSFESLFIFSVINTFFSFVQKVEGCLVTPSPPLDVIAPDQFYGVRSDPLLYSLYCIKNHIARILYIHSDLTIFSRSFCSSRRITRLEIERFHTINIFQQVIRNKEWEEKKNWTQFIGTDN